MRYKVAFYSIIIVVSFGVVGGVIAALLSRFFNVNPSWFGGAIAAVMVILSVLLINRLFFR